MFGKGGMGNLMKQAQQMQDRMQKLQEEIANMTPLCDTTRPTMYAALLR